MIDYSLGTTIYTSFSTAIAGVGTALLGSPTVAVYANGSATPITAGITLTVNFGLTGQHRVAIVATAANGYATATDYSLVVTQGLLGGINVTSWVIDNFSIEKGATPVPINNPSTPVGTEGRGTVASGASTTSIPTSAFTMGGAGITTVANQFKTRVIIFDGNTTTVGLRGVAAAIYSNTASSTPTFVVTADTILPATPVAGDTFNLI